MLRLEMTRRSLRASDLAKLLGGSGRRVSDASIHNKLSRGSFSAAFLLESLAAMGCEGGEIARLFDMVRVSDRRPGPE